MVIMIGHLGLNVPDLGEAKAYCDKLAPLVDFEEFFHTDDQCAYRPAGGKPGTYLFLYPSTEPAIYSRHGTGFKHLAFMVKERRDVDAVHGYVVPSRR